MQGDDAGARTASTSPARQRNFRLSLYRLRVVGWLARSDRRRKDNGASDGSATGAPPRAHFAWSLAGMRVVFIGTGAIAVPALRMLRAKHDLAAVITQPDQPAGRKQRITPPPIKMAMTGNAVVILQPPR